MEEIDETKTLEEKISDNDHNNSKIVIPTGDIAFIQLMGILPPNKHHTKSMLSIDKSGAPLSMAMMPPSPNPLSEPFSLK